MAVGWLILALIVGAVVLNILGPIRGISEKRFAVTNGMLPGLPVEVTPNTMRPWMIRMVSAALLFELVIPGILYAIFAEKLDQSGILLGMAFWGGAWLIGALPQYVFEPLLIHIPRRFVLHNIVWSLLIYLIIGAVVGIIYPA